MAAATHVRFAVLFVSAVLTSGCQVRGFLGFGNEPAEPLPVERAPRTKVVRPAKPTPPAPVVASAPIKTEDSVIFPQPQSAQAAPKALAPEQVAGTAASRTGPLPVDEQRLPPLPDADDPPGLRGYLTQAAHALVRGQVGKSADLYGRALKRAPFNPYALHGLALTEARQGRFAKARSLAARSQFMNATDAALGQANARLLEELDDALEARARRR